MISSNELETILSQETALYRRLFDLEQKKTAAIIKRDGHGLEDLYTRQEHLLAEVMALEEKRRTVIDAIAANNPAPADGAGITLGAITQIAGLDASASERLSRIGAELKTVLTEIQGIQQNNQRMLQDSIDFFRSIVDGIRNSLSIKTGYSPNGSEQSICAGPLLLNKKI